MRGELAVEPRIALLDARQVGPERLGVPLRGGRPEPGDVLAAGVVEPVAQALVERVEGAVDAFLWGSPFPSRSRSMRRS